METAETGIKLSARIESDLNINISYVESIILLICKKPCDT